MTELAKKILLKFDLRRKFARANQSNVVPNSRLAKQVEGNLGKFSNRPNSKNQ